MRATRRRTIHSSLDSEVLHGARSILVANLHLEPSDILVLFYDETTDEVAQAINCAATELNIVSIVHRIEVAEQIRRGSYVPQSAADEEDLACARAILICISDSASNGPFRHSLLDTVIGAGKRVGHMPGVTIDVVAQSKQINSAQMEQRCEELALALLVGRKARIDTYSVGRTGECSLFCELGEFARPSITSSGLIHAGTWGNIPGGESFISPLEGTANGVYLLNGSFTGTVIPSDQELCLVFDKGSLIEVRGNDSLRNSFLALLSECRQGLGSSKLQLAELGIGVNESIRSLTGHSLSDEKCAGTVHIAVGDNESYGGKIEAEFHEDFVTKGASVWIDDKAVINRGRYVLRQSDWYEQLITSVTERNEAGNLRCQRKLGRAAEKSPDGELVVDRRVGAEKRCRYRISDSTTNKLLWKIYENTKSSEIVSTRHIAQCSGLSPQLVNSLICMLVKHELLEVMA